MYQVDNAVIMAAGTASRLVPLSYERPKALTVVKGEVLIERQIRQLQEAGIKEIIVVTGYKKELFDDLQQKFGVRLIENPYYLSRNNNASIYSVRDFLHNTYICSCDNYFTANPFEKEVEESYYAAIYAAGETQEWCFVTDEDDYITDVTIGGRDSWHMFGHAFWSEEFSRNFLRILLPIYEDPRTYQMYWENIFMQHLQELKMKIQKYPPDVIQEFDSLNDLRAFDSSYWEDTRSAILKEIARRLGCSERELIDFENYKNGSNAAAGFTFQLHDRRYRYHYEDGTLIED